MFELEIYETINILGLILGMVFGMIAQKNQFCFSGSIKDYILTKSTKRGASVVVAMIVAIIATTLVSSYFELDLTKTVYYKQDVNYFIIIFGGLLFGTGMMIADGCSNRHLIKFGQGDSRSLITLVFIAIFGFATAKGLIQGYLSPITNNETLLEISSMIENSTMNIYVVLAVLFVILFLLTKSIKRIFTLVDGFLIGLLIAAAWAITGVMGEESMERLIELSGVSFIYPTAKSLELFMFYQVNEFTFPIALVCGMILGAFTMSYFNKKYSFGCTATQKVNRVTYNMIGGALMGTGGILSIGCTVGQGLTGMSTLAFASFLAISSIFISGVITAKILNKSGKLPMCFLFEWNDTPPDYTI
ncbi:MAG: YeeE/YedE family protein [Arcobacter sp.]|uniref:YeeE/YedE family protein n=1 Tax=uncultured Arcobacter sp. TaxID=165434 RepID=UPI000CB09F3E|nr:YeeE/YedE family protein [uncultured Arcobacter sp.]PLY10014.1 MAG: YeeE/YedE family protein [Arcobacter sp.]